RVWGPHARMRSSVSAWCSAVELSQHLSHPSAMRLVSMMKAIRSMHLLGTIVTTLFFANVATGQSQLHLFPGDAPNELHGGTVAGIGDIDGDGYDELIVGAVEAGVGGPVRV